MAALNCEWYPPACVRPASHTRVERTRICPAAAWLRSISRTKVETAWLFCYRKVSRQPVRACLPYRHGCCWRQRNRMRRGRGTEAAIDAASEATKEWYSLWTTLLPLFPGAEAGQYRPRGKRRCVGRRSSHPDGPVAAGIPLIETASKNVPSLDETVRRCDSDTRAGGVDGCVQAASNKQHAACPADRPTCCVDMQVWRCLRIGTASLSC
jgi:hypothetical protein